ncbi:hypothetical protein BKP37_09145 [Anaerobacillus alkalilacustris]|uniref:Sulfatase N-terminal domain-containing protein n=1 Tax=Anaerobacillus alkalilacustris TaxID=393763 RepID=A0A1S2LRD9_9BACI|nr:LTA synthase family protein [Anaerobacillus alkalilacustris]OIJ14237.1 hypothetical protein BKP37_09145 [Anaerobacillus alkalilacustris]
MQKVTIEPPDGYYDVTFNELLTQLKEEEIETEIRPNFIFVMNESFWDPTRLPNLTFSEDPMPFFRSLQKNHTSGELIVPVLGGSTANTEFEVLTGNSIHMLPQGSLAYSQFVNHPHPSLASTLKNNGYETVAIHSYHDWFYRRNEVYTFFDFDRFESYRSFKNPEYRRDFISDLEVSKQIIIEHQNSEGPLFIFAVTMQNHGPYNMRHYPEDRIEVTDMHEDITKVLNNYSTGVKDADDSLQLLVNYFRKIDDPTVIVFFGDHLPYLGAAYEGYTITGYLNDANPRFWEKDDYEKMYSVPFVIWDNFSDEKNADLRMSSSFLGAFVLEKYSQPQTPIMRFLNKTATKGAVVFSSRRDVNEFSLEDAKRYHLLQYDQLFGGQGPR